MKRFGWIDALRGIAIIGVVIGHSMDIYSQMKVEFIWRHMAYTIPWFVFLSGFTNARSLLNLNSITLHSSFRFYIKRFSAILPYCLATVIVYVLLNYPSIQLSDLFHQLIYFSAQPTYYFINLILLLYFTAPLLLFIDTHIKKIGVKILFTIFLWYLSFYVFSRNLTLFHIKDFSGFSLPWPFVSGGLFDGSGYYLFIFYCGIQYINLQNKMKSLSVWIILAFFAVFEVLLISNKNLFHLGPYRNYFYVTWSIGFLIISERLVNFMYLKKISLTLLENMGQHSLFIYLFHYAILYFFRFKIVFSVFNYFYILVASIFIPLIISNAIPVCIQIWRKRLGKSICE